MRSRYTIFIFSIFLWQYFSVVAYAQSQSIITGTVYDGDYGQPIPLVNVALYDSSKTHLLTGVVTNAAGEFKVEISFGEPKVLQISAMGYDTFVEYIQPVQEETIRLGDIILEPALLEHEDVEIVGQQVQARSKTDRTSFYVDQNLKAAASSGAEVLRFIPGIQVDLMNNISLQGSRNILVLVNGRERSPDILNSLNVEHIKQVDVLENPPARYDANADGVINIILEEKQDAHFNGYVHAESPASPKTIYIFPSYSLEYGTGKINLFTSYNGDFRYFDVEEHAERTLLSGAEPLTMYTTQHVRQKNWSHKFNYGGDYFASEKHTFSLYGWLNPFSGENDGDISTRGIGHTDFSKRSEEDTNLAAFHSLYYIFTPNPPSGHTLSMETSLFTLNSVNRMIFEDETHDEIRENFTEPTQRTYRAKADYSLPMNDQFLWNVGAQAKFQSMGNAASDAFSYTDQSLAMYSALHYQTPQLDIQAGIRAEEYRYHIQQEEKDRIFGLFPNISFHYKHPQSAQSVKLSYRRSVRYPQLYQLNPGQFFEDPFAYRTGNIRLSPAFADDIQLELARIPGNSHLSLALFYNKESDAVQSLTSVTNQQLFETKSYNSGNFHRYGTRVSANIELGSRTGIQPYIRVFGVQTVPNEFAEDQGIRNQRSLEWEAGISAYTGFGDGFTVSGVLDYASSRQRFQRTEFSDALYFVSIGKSLWQNSKIEIAGGLPFRDSFTYRGYEIDTPAFRSHSEGILQLSDMTLIFRFTVRFSKGEQRRTRIQHDDTVTPERQRQGF